MVVIGDAAATGRPENGMNQNGVIGVVYCFSLYSK